MVLSMTMCFCGADKFYLSSDPEELAIMFVCTGCSFGFTMFMDERQFGQYLELVEDKRHTTKIKE